MIIKVLETQGEDGYQVETKKRTTVENSLYRKECGYNKNHCLEKI